MRSTAEQTPKDRGKFEVIHKVIDRPIHHVFSKWVHQIINHRGGPFWHLRMRSAQGQHTQRWLVSSVEKFFDHSCGLFREFRLG